MTAEQLLNIANQCLLCKKPTCKEACPIHLDIPNIMKNIQKNNITEAKQIIKEQQAIPFICGYLCNQQKQCEGNCIKGLKQEPVEIGLVEAVLGLNILEEENNVIIPKKKNKKIAIIGGGPCGLSTAYFLLKAGLQVTIFEKEKQLGGILQQYIPDFRYDLLFTYHFINNLINMGLNIETEKELGKNLFIDDLHDFQDIVITIGATKAKKVLPNNERVIQALDILKLNKKNKLTIDFDNKTVLIIGGGNVAYDVARVLVRKKAKVIVCYRRDIANSPATQAEIKKAQTEGVIIKECLAPHSLIVNQDQILTGVHFEKTILVKGENDRLNFLGTKKYLDIPCQYVVEAVGASSDYDYLKSVYPSIFDDKGYLIVDEHYETPIKHLYVGGDFLAGPKTFVDASLASRVIAKSIK